MKFNTLLCSVLIIINIVTIIIVLFSTFISRWPRCHKFNYWQMLPSINKVLSVNFIFSVNFDSQVKTAQIIVNFETKLITSLL